MAKKRRRGARSGGLLNVRLPVPRLPVSVELADQGSVRRQQGSTATVTDASTPADQDRTPADRDHPRKLHTVELGVTGTTVFSGFIINDPNAELLFPKNVAIYDKMRRTDGQVKAALLAITLPILSQEWTVEPYTEQDEHGHPKEATPEARQVARFLEEDLFRGMSTPWKLMLRQILGMLWAGFWVVEPVFRIEEDGLVHLRKLATRLPQTIFRWMMERDGGLRSVIQRGVNPATGAIEEVTIPIEDMLIFVHDREGADWTGMSVLRSAYKHWYMKDWLYRIGVINVERAGGVPVFAMPEGANDADLKAARNVGESFHLHERAYILEPFGWKFRLESGATRQADITPQVEHHDHKIAANILAQFMDFGAGGDTGGAGRGGTAEFVDVFMMALEATITEIEDTANRYLIPKWVDYNWRLPGYPRLKAQNVRGFNVRRMGLTLRALADGRIVLPDDKLEAFIRDGMGLPEAEVATRREGPTPLLGGGGPVVPADVLPPSPPGAGETGAEKGTPGDNPVPGEQKRPGEGTKGAQVLGERLDPTAAELAEFATTQIDLPADLADKLRAWSERIPSEDLAAGGLEDQPHVTVKYGLHTSRPSMVGELLQGEPPIPLTLGPVQLFAEAEYDVVYVAVASPALERLNAKLTRELQSTATQAKYVPHATLAYVKPGKGAVYAGDATFAGTPVVAGHVTFVAASGGQGPVVLALDRADNAAKERLVQGLRVVDALQEMRRGLALADVDLTRPLEIRRALTSLERCVEFAEIDRRTKRAAVELMDRLKPIQEDQMRAVSRVARKALDELRDVKVPYVGKLASTVRGQLREVFEYGRAQVRDELLRQATVERAPIARELADPGDRLANKQSVLQLIGVKADVLAERWSLRLKDAAVTAKLRAVRAGLDEDATEAEVDAALDALSDKATRALVLQTISEAFALGRRVEAEARADQIDEMQYSALLDDNTCEVCAELDGETGPLDDQRLQTPNPNCLGEQHGNTCRCINVYQVRRGELREPALTVEGLRTLAGQIAAEAERRGLKATHEEDQA